MVECGFKGKIFGRPKNETLKEGSTKCGKINSIQHRQITATSKPKPLLSIRDLGLHAVRKTVSLKIFVL